MTSFLDRANSEGVKAVLVGHPGKFLFPYSSLWGVAAGHFSSTLILPCPSSNAALSYLYVAWRTCWMQTLCTALQRFTNVFSVTENSRILPYQWSRQGNSHSKRKINVLQVWWEWHPSSSFRSFQPKTPKRTTSPTAQIQTSWHPFTRVKKHGNLSQGLLMGWIKPALPKVLLAMYQNIFGLL